MGIKQVRKLEEAAEAVKHDAAEAGRRLPHIQMWLVSTSGFAQDVVEYIADRDEIYASDHDGINRIFQAYGGNYRIPVFEHQEKTLACGMFRQGCLEIQIDIAFG